MTNKVCYIVSICCLVILIFSKCSSKPLNNTKSIDCKDILISPISDQEVLAETGSYVPLAAVTNQLNQVKFKITEGPKFISIQKTQRGRALLMIDPSIEDKGVHQINIEANNGSREGCITFKIKVIENKSSSRIIHCDPTQDNEGNGSLEKPFSSLSNLLKSGFKTLPNDQIVLHEGNHGDVALTGSGYSVSSYKKSSARLNSLNINKGSRIQITGLEITPENEIGDHDEYLVFIDSTSSLINFSNNIVVSTPDASNWTPQEWTDKASRGIKCLAKVSVIQNNLIQNVFHGIKTEGNQITVKYNHVDRFGGDAIRNMGSFNTYNHNFLSNATVDDYYDEGGNHDDLFQSWTFGKPVDKIRLSHNIMIGCLDTLMPNRAKIVQGLVCFDGFESNWVVDNNLVVTDHPHGIALYGATNCEVYENTVLKNPNNLYQFESHPWIMINNHKDGRLSTDNKVRNNITSAMNIVSKDVYVKENIILDSTQITNLKQYHEWDFRIKE